MLIGLVSPVGATCTEDKTAPSMSASSSISSSTPVPSSSTTPTSAAVAGAVPSVTFSSFGSTPSNSSIGNISLELSIVPYLPIEILIV